MKLKKTIWLGFEGELITSETNLDGGKVYLVEGERKNWITSPDTFEKLGFEWGNIKRIPDSILKKFMDGKSISENVYDIRFKITAPFLKGHGLEIGAGTNPQNLPKGVVCDYFDKRDVDELAEYFDVGRSRVSVVYSFSQFHEIFPNKADFLIAHNVLEHCSDPISALIEWNSYVKNDGIIVISVPSVDHCPDSGRNITSFEHNLLDYLLERTEDSFDSREHIYSFIMGWIDDGGFKGKDKFEVAKEAHNCAKAEINDLHWHVFNEEVLRKAVLASAFFSNKGVKIELIAAPDKEKNLKTGCEIICIYRIFNQEHVISDESFLKDIKKTKEKLIKGLEKLSVLNIYTNKDW